MSTGIARRLLSGSALRVIYLVTSILVSFYMLPFLVHSLGDRWYGFWALAGNIVGYYGVLDLGLTPAAHRFLAMAHGRGDREETSRVFTTAFALFAAGGLIAMTIAGIMWAAVPWLVSPGDAPTVRLLVLLLGASFAIGFPVAVFNGILAATLRYDISSYLQFAKLVTRTTLVVLAFQRTPSVVTLAWLTLATEAGTNAATVICATRLWPWVRLSPGLFDRGKVSEFFNYGVFSFFVRLGDLVRWAVDNVVVAKFLGVAAVTHYSIAMRLTDAFQDAFAQAVSVLAPVTSRYHGADNRSGLFDLVRQATRLTVALAVSAAGAAIIFGASFIRRWMGPAYLDAYGPLVVLICAALLSVMQMPAMVYLYAIARHKYYSALNGIDAAANLGLSLALAPRIGMMGVALGTLLPTLVVKLVLQPRYVCLQLGLPFAQYWKEVSGVFIRALALQAPIAVIVYFVQPGSYPSILGLALGLYALHGIALFLFVLWPEDQKILADAVPPLAVLMTMRRRLIAAVSGGSN